jgi:small subunit ribosomal protein S1
MPTEYDAKGNYAYPDGFNSETGEWLDGFDDQRKVWEQQYADAQARWQSHKAQVAHMNSIVIEPIERPESDEAAAVVNEVVESVGTLADDEALSALRDKLVGNDE